uniref:Uncharacterized protein n=1 Tax=Plectus sambesii TaxID=2011161 RepID=A0A914WMZ4_9BILA
MLRTKQLMQLALLHSPSGSLVHRRLAQTLSPAVYRSPSHEVDIPRNTTFPVLLSMGQDWKGAGKQAFTRWRGMMRDRTSIKYALSEAQIALEEEEEGFCLTDWPFFLSFYPPGDVGMAYLKTWYYRLTSHRKALKLINEHDKDFDVKEMLRTNAVLAHTVSTKLAKGDYSALEGMIEQSVLEKMIDRVETLTDQQRQLLNFGMGDYLDIGGQQWLPRLLDVEVEKDCDRLVARFSCLDCAVYQVNKIKFEEVVGEYERPPGTKYFEKGLIRTLGNTFLLDLEDYPYKIPRQIVLNTILTRQLAPVLSKDYFISEMNIIVAP